MRAFLHANANLFMTRKAKDWSCLCDLLKSLLCSFYFLFFDASTVFLVVCYRESLGRNHLLQTAKEAKIIDLLEFSSFPCHEGILKRTANLQSMRVQDITRVLKLLGSRFYYCNRE